MQNIEQLKAIVGEDNVLVQEPMKYHTTFQAGGPAAYFVSPKTERELAEVIFVCKENKIPWMVVGRGSNLLVSDAGFDGVVISLRKHFSQISVHVDTQVIEAGAGAMMPAVAAAAKEAGLGGFEFASGIPGTIGGGVLMNAGAYGGEIKDVLIDVTILKADGSIAVVSKEEACLSYRHSAFEEMEAIILSCRLQLFSKAPDEIKALMDDLNSRRKEKQPLEYGSAGSTFKRPTGYFAGKLIEDAGLKGFSIGDAQVSEKHAGFVINRGNASASEIYAVCREVKRRVKECFDVSLELEVRLAGPFESIDCDLDHKDR